MNFYGWEKGSSEDYSAWLEMIDNEMVEKVMAEDGEPDEQILCQKLQSAGVNARFYIGNGLNHDYPMHNTPEGKNAVRLIMDIIAGITPGEEEASSSD